jgi:outer membrane protein assembly factor BamB
MLRLLLVAVISAMTASQWTEFRGPQGTGIARDARIPERWSETENVRWKVPVHGRAWSSPVVLGQQIWLTTATPDGKQLYAMAFDKDTGKTIYDLKLFDVATPQFAHSFNTYASPSPIIEAGRVYVTFGSPGTAAIDTKTGKVIWERRDLECNHFRGAGSSPILFRDLLIMHFDGSDVQYVVALDKRTGKTVWKTPRSVDFKDIEPNGKIKADGDFRKAFATPIVVTAGPQPVLISPGSMAAYGYDPLTGKELWRLEDRTSFS